MAAVGCLALVRGQEKIVRAGVVQRHGPAVKPALLLAYTGNKHREHIRKHKTRRDGSMGAPIFVVA